jgi:hypothetical protein
MNKYGVVVRVPADGKVHVWLNQLHTVSQCREELLPLRPSEIPVQLLERPPGSGGCRKVRWTRTGMGKRSGVRVIYYNQLDNGLIYLLVIYAKAVRGNIPAHILKAIRETLDVES